MEGVTTSLRSIKGAPKKKKAKWVLQEIINKRKADGSCPRCGEKGHLIRFCTLSRAKPLSKLMATAAPSSPRIEELGSNASSGDELGNLLLLPIGSGGRGKVA